MLMRLSCPGHTSAAIFKLGSYASSSSVCSCKNSCTYAVRFADFVSNLQRAQHQPINQFSFCLISDSNEKAAYDYIAGTVRLQENSDRIKNCINAYIYMHYTRYTLSEKMASPSFCHDFIKY